MLIVPFNYDFFPNLTITTTAVIINAIPIQFPTVRLPPNTVSDTTKAVMGSNAPMMLAGVEPMMWMLDVTSANDKKVVKNDNPNALPHISHVVSLAMPLPSIEIIKNNTAPESVAKNASLSVGNECNTLRLTPTRYTA